MRQMHREKETKEDETTVASEVKSNKSSGRGLRAAAQKFVIYRIICICVYNFVMCATVHSLQSYYQITHMHYLRCLHWQVGIKTPASFL